MAAFFVGRPKKASPSSGICCRLSLVGLLVPLRSLNTSSVDMIQEGWVESVELPGTLRAVNMGVRVTQPAHK